MQEFYETIIAAKDVLLGILRNHGEDTWIAYVTQGQAVHTLTGCSQRADTCTCVTDRCKCGKLDAEPLYGTPNNPQALAQGLIRLWRDHGERILTLPAEIITQKEE